MIPRQALAALDAEVPKLNPLLANGLAITHVAKAEEYVDSVIRSAASGFPPGFRYLGPTRLNPEEEFEETTRAKANKRRFDVAPSWVYLVRYDFQFNEEPIISKYVYLPYVGQAGTIMLSGSRYVISPVLADRVISVSVHSIFVRLLKTRLTFNRLNHPYIADGHMENIQVAWGRIHNDKSQPSRPTVKAVHTVVHYLLGKYGFTGMFQKFLGITPIYGTDDITTERFPVKDWVICQSNGLKPKGVRATGTHSYAPSPIRVAIKRSDYAANADVRNLLAGFFYVVDHFPHRVQAEHMDDTRLWMVLLGHVIYSDHRGDAKLLAEIRDHYQSLDDYIDNITLHMLKEIGYPCADFYELLFTVVSNFNDWLLSSDDRVSTMYDKELNILYFMFVDIIKAVNNLVFKLNSAKKKEKGLTNAKIMELLTTYLRAGLIYSLTKSAGVCSSQSTSGDNKALKFTNILVPQSESNRQAANKTRTVIKDPAKRLHGSIAEVGNYVALPKSSPDGRARLNLCLSVNESGLVLRNKEYMPAIDHVNHLIRLSRQHQPK